MERILPLFYISLLADTLKNISPMRCLPKKRTVLSTIKINCLDENACNSKELCYKLIREELQQAAEGRKVHSEPSVREYLNPTWEVTQHTIKSIRFLIQYNSSRGMPSREVNSYSVSSNEHCPAPLETPGTQ